MAKYNVIHAEERYSNSASFLSSLLSDGWGMTARGLQVSSLFWRKASIHAGTPGPTASTATPSGPCGLSKWWVALTQCLNILTDHVNMYTISPLFIPYQSQSTFSYHFSANLASQYSRVYLNTL